MPNAPTPLNAAMEMAAVATAAIPDLQIHAVKPAGTQSSKGISAWATAAGGDEWQMYSLDAPPSKTRLESALHAQSELANARLAGRLPFNVPVIRAIVKRRDGRLVFIFPALGGEEATESTFSSATLFPSSLAGALGALHCLDPRRVADSGVPRQGADAHRSEVEALLRRHWTTVPSDLRTRWNNALRDDTLWQYESCIIHGSLEPADVQVAGGGAVVAIKGFDRVRIGDPAQDVAWLLYHAEQGFLDRFETTYAQQRDHRDLHLMTRARLIAELETLRWYDAGVKINDTTWRQEGRLALREMDQELRGTTLVDAPQDVVHIEFGADEEPLLRLKRNHLAQTAEMEEEFAPKARQSADLEASGAASGAAVPDQDTKDEGVETAATTIHPAPWES